jgi:ribonuclease J
MASSDNRWIKVGPEDTVILSSHPIPGNEASVSKIIDGMTRLGAEVIHSGIDAVHATGHAKQEELKTLLSIAQPDWFTPVHGEYRHLTSHARLAHSMGMTDDRVLVCEDGDQLLLTDLGVTRGQEVPAGYLYVDGIVGDVGQGVLRDRRVLAEEGVVVVVVTVDARTGAIVTGPEVITRGWVYAPEAEDLIDECADEVRAAVQESFKSGDPADIEALQRVVRKTAGRFVADRTRRRPMIVPVVMET